MWLSIKEIEIPIGYTELYWYVFPGTSVEMCRIIAYEKGLEITTTDGERSFLSKWDSPGIQDAKMFLKIPEEEYPLEPAEDFPEDE